MMYSFQVPYFWVTGLPVLQQFAELHAVESGTVCVSSADPDGEQLWCEEDPVHPLYNGYERIIDTIIREADSLRSGGKRPGYDIAPAAKKPRVDIQRPRWIDQPTGNVMHGGYQPHGGQQWSWPGSFGKGRFWRLRLGFRGSRRN
jgi:hypothetical protein